MSSSALKAGDGRKSSRTRSDVVDALREYHARYGDVTSACFNPSTARWRGREDLAQRYLAGREDGRRWPSLNSIKAHFDGSFNAALTAADLPISKPGGGRRRVSATPITDVRVDRVMIESDRDRELSGRIALLEEQRDRLRERAREAERKLADRPRVKVREKIVREPSKVVEKTVVKPSAADKRRIASLERKLERAETTTADCNARVKQLVNQNAKLSQRYDKLEADAEKIVSERDDALADARESRYLMQGTADRLDASESLVKRLRTDLRAAESNVTTEVQVEIADEALVTAAEKRADDAELRAARAERQMVEQAQAITGKPRKLTAGEIKELRSNGPAGPAVLANALAEVAGARKTGGKSELRSALRSLMSAAATWEDRL